jgi:hypothetical protein
MVEGLHMPEDQATVAMWVKPDERRECYLLSEQYLGFYIRLRGDIIWAAFYRDVVAQTGKLLKAGEWNHVAVRYGDTVDVFVNGREVASVIASKADYKSDCHKREMNFFGDKYGRFSMAGLFEDLRVYNRLLDEDEILSLAGE